MLPACVPQKNVTKTDIHRSLYRIHHFFFLTILQIFVPRLEIFFCIHHYFLVFICKYRTRLRVIYGLKFRGTVFIQTISTETAQKIDKQQQKRVSAVWSPDGVFTISASAVFLFRPFSVLHLVVLDTTELTNVVSILWGDNFINFPFSPYLCVFGL